MTDEQRHGYKHDPAAWSARQADALRRPVSDRQANPSLPLAGKLPSPMPRRSVRRSSRPRRGRNWNSKSAPPMPVADRTSARPRVLARRLTLTAPSSRVSLHSFAPAPFTTIGGPSGPQSKSGTSAIDSSPTAAQNSSSALPAGASTHPFSARRWRARPFTRSGPGNRHCP
jgi:hypothetical protein